MEECVTFGFGIFILFFSPPAFNIMAGFEFIYDSGTSIMRHSGGDAQS